jgi:hypothetical protein
VFLESAALRAKQLNHSESATNLLLIERQSVQLNQISVAHLTPSLSSEAAKGLRRLPNLTGRCATYHTILGSIEISFEVMKLALNLCSL